MMLPHTRHNVIPASYTKQIAQEATHMSQIFTTLKELSLTGTEEHGTDGEMKRIVDGRAVSVMSRRNFFSSLGAAGSLAAGGALIGCSDSPSPVTTTAPTTTPSPTATPSPTTTPAPPSVVDVLNFALNLEYLEASFYLYVTSGSGLSTADMGSNPGTVTGGAKVNFSNSVVASAAAQIATHEREHVEFLRSTITAIGGTPVSMPNLNLAAMGAVTSDATFLALARQFEGVGVSAYAGGAQYLTSSTAGLTYAAQILHTESQHESFLRQLCISLGVTSPAADAQDIPPTATAVFNTNTTTGLFPVRTTSQVLQIVYGAAGKTGVKSGGFFPSGLNGNIVSS
jgi:hypothetical protein